MAKKTEETKVVEVKKLGDVGINEFYSTFNDTVKEDGSGSIAEVVSALGITVTADTRAKVHQAVSQRATNLRKDLAKNPDAVKGGLVLYSSKVRGRSGKTQVQGLVAGLLESAK